MERAQGSGQGSLPVFSSALPKGKTSELAGVAAAMIQVKCREDPGWTGGGVRPGPSGCGAGQVASHTVTGAWGEGGGEQKIT